MIRYLQGAAFYLFFYLLLGLLNSAIMYVGVKFLHVTPTIILALLVFLTVFVLFFGFKKSIEVVFGFIPSNNRLILGWAVQFMSFIVLASTVEVFVSRFISSVKFFQVLTVFINFSVFFFTYWLSVRAIVLRGDFEVR